MNNKNQNGNEKCNQAFNTISLEGTINYVGSFIEQLQDRVCNGEPHKQFYEEQILFFTQALTYLKRHKVLVVDPFSAPEFTPGPGKKPYTRTYQATCGITVYARNDEEADTLFNAIDSDCIWNEMHENDFSSVTTMEG